MSVPTAAALAATWNRDLVYRVGEALAQECLAEKVVILLGPGANIKRSPLCGRNFEYFSEDSYLTGEMAKAHIRGVQSKGIGTALKHWSTSRGRRGSRTTSRRQFLAEPRHRRNRTTLVLVRMSKAREIFVLEETRGRRVWKGALSGGVNKGSKGWIRYDRIYSEILG